MTAKSRREQIEEMLREEPNDPELGYMLAMEYASSGDDAGAVRWFQELMARTYGKRDTKRGQVATVAWLAEETGELILEFRPHLLHIWRLYTFILRTGRGRKCSRRSPARRTPTATTRSTPTGRTRTRS